MVSSPDTVSVFSQNTVSSIGAAPAQGRSIYPRGPSFSLDTFSVRWPNSRRVSMTEQQTPEQRVRRQGFHRVAVRRSCCSTLRFARCVRRVSSSVLVYSFHAQHSTQSHTSEPSNMPSNVSTSCLKNGNPTKRNSHPLFAEWKGSIDNTAPCSKVNSTRRWSRSTRSKAV